MKFRLIIILMAMTAVLIAGTFGCTPQPSFGNLQICARIGQHCQPVQLQDRFEIEQQAIYATIEVANIPSGDQWTFRWIDPSDETVLAESSGRYMEVDYQYVSGYYASLLTADTQSGIIAAPGRYQVEYYHNQDLVDRAVFTIEEPLLQVLEAQLSTEVNADGSPAKETDTFFLGERIMLSIKLNCLIEDTRIQASWSGGQDQKGQSTLDIEQNHFAPGYQVLQLGEDVLPPGSYELEINIDGIPASKLSFYICADTPKEVYTDAQYHFSLAYPHWLEPSVQENEIYQVVFSPKHFEANILLSVWVLEAALIPQDPQRSSFIEDVLLKGIEDAYDLQLAEIKEAQKMHTYHYTGPDHSAWRLLLSFKDEEESVYMLMGLADHHYMEGLEQIYDPILDSFAWEFEE